jgi:hypothetical protein
MLLEVKCTVSLYVGFFVSRRSGALPMDFTPQQAGRTFLSAERHGTLAVRIV